MVLFLVNQVPYRDVVAKIRLKGIPDRDKYHLVDIVRNSLYLKDGRATITGRELQEGINLFLPDQERVVLLLTRDDYQTPNPPQELLDDAAARKMDRKVKKEIKTAADREAQEARVSRETILGIKNFGAGSNSFEQIKKSAFATAGVGLAEVQLLDADNSWHVNSYGLREGTDSVLRCRFVYKETLAKETIDKAQTDILDALGQKFQIKVIKSGLTETGFWYLQQYRNVAETGCYPLDIRKQANMGIVDEKADDQKGGLFDEGRSLADFPVGRQKFSNILFDIIDPARNNGSSCIILKGQAKPYFPEKIEGIPVGRKVKNIYLLNASAWISMAEGVAYRVCLNYADGTSGMLEVKVGSEIKDWFNAAGTFLNMVNAKLGWQGKAREVRKDPNGENETIENDVGLYCCRLVNPQPEKEVRTLDLISANARVVPGIFGITVEE